jgi:hypothetical protein
VRSRSLPSRSPAWFGSPRSCAPVHTLLPILSRCGLSWLEGVRGRQASLPVCKRESSSSVLRTPTPPTSSQSSTAGKLINYA